MTDIAEFLTARLDEDEEAACAATPGTWVALDGGVQSHDDETQWPVSDTESVRNREDRVHIARHDPARVLREVAAKRRILGVILDTIRDNEHLLRSDRDIDSDVSEPLLHALAEPYADHPDYDESWRP